MERRKKFRRIKIKKSTFPEERKKEGEAILARGGDAEGEESLYLKEEGGDKGGQDGPFLIWRKGKGGEGKKSLIKYRRKERKHLISKRGGKASG